MCFGVVFFFKQKTAYEVRSSDWSSDVCSSDLVVVLADLVALGVELGRQHGDVTGLLVELDARVLLGSRRLVVRRQERLLDGLDEDLELDLLLQIGRASCRERVCQYV